MTKKQMEALADMIVEKLTELGVKDFFPITTERTIRKPSANSVEKFNKVCNIFCFIRIRLF